ncbi:putative spermine/spermidine synthase [Aspergillus taichungensis]|uniref:Putative spermine/spermidine synthase n=1 Tax=Aspergillus taichungensis TaxID=482145 RepID=A0A2J5HED3_9EURO|nr:putative spermine/spermidine synthase [Aspergillus taichungensis]
MPSVIEILRRADKRRLRAGMAALFLAAFSSPVTLRAMSPVYGGAPSHIFHGYGAGVVAAAAWFLKDHVHRLSRRKAVYFLPILAFWIPTVQYLMFQQSSLLGNPLGPLLTDIFTFYPLLFLSVACAGKWVQLGLRVENDGDLMAEHVPLLGSYVVYAVGLKFAKAFIARFIGSFYLFTSGGLQLIIAALYSAAIPSKLLLLALPSILFSTTANVHMPFGRTTAAMDSALHEEGYALVARQESTTGYISVLDNLEDGFRVMRCDHSLLGGQWTKTHRNYDPAVKDPIYAVFTMLEAVRLVEDVNGGPRTDAGRNALVIGLGVGTTPSALMSHGIDTTVVELDPVVHKFAQQYFHMPSNHVAAIEDATDFVQRARQAAQPVEYDYIVHDVFTGGAEPVELFTLEFLQGLDALLKHDGVIAINYAGDLNLHPASLAVRTIQAVFPSCRIFREDVPVDNTSDFTNMVVFCTKSRSPEPLRFRESDATDYLGSQFRQAYLVPKHEIDPAVFQNVHKGGSHVLRAKDTGRLSKAQDRGALEHWGIMRTVMPNAVWENY